MKRIGGLYDKIFNIDNLILADKKARKGKSKQYGIKIFDLHREENIYVLQEMLKSKTYKTSKYTTFTINEGKERAVYKLPYFPDRIAHHAIMNVLEPIFLSAFTFNTFSCIKNR